MKEAVHDCLCTQPKQFLSDGMGKLVNHGIKYVKKQEDYAEKWYISNLTQ
jgi:hypothetical protein